MCGIAGYWNVRSGRPADLGVLQSMVSTLTHRGPDEDGFWVEGALAIGMRRLSVVDPAGGHQPMPGEDGSVRVILNGEIYNHEDLRRELEKRGHRFRTRSDTESVVHAYEQWGPECIRRMDGMFAVAVWDARTPRLLIARDRLGVKPLYVHEGPEGVVFGSELKAVVSAPWVPVEWDLAAVDDFMTYEYVPSPRSIVRDVRKLPAGTLLTYEPRGGGAGSEHRYWTLEAAAEPESPVQAREELRTRLAASVRARLMSDVPLGAFLSGGLDSTVVVGLMNEVASEPVRSFSVGFDDPSYDELPFARMAAARFQTVHREEVLRPQAVDLAEPLADHFDEPFADVSAFPTYAISEVARRDVTVVLSGDGGDELFAGYDGYRAHRWAHRLRWITGNRLWQPVSAILDWLPPASAKKGAINKAKRFAEGLRRPTDLEHARWWVFWDLLERRRLYDPGLMDRLGTRDPFAFYRGRLQSARESGFDGLQAQLYADVTGYLPDDILVKLDRMSMAVSLEARVPFLDHRVVEYAMAIPARWKIRNGQTKWILRTGFDELLPPPIRRRGKEGFSMPMKHWLRSELQPTMQTLLDGRRLSERGWFDPDEVQRLIDEHLSGRENHAHRLWCLMSLELAVDALSSRATARTSAEHDAVGAAPSDPLVEPEGR